MGLNLGGIIGGIVGAMIPGGSAITAALGAGLGAKASGASNKEAMMYGIGGLMLGGGGAFGGAAGGAAGKGLLGGLGAYFKKDPITASLMGTSLLSGLTGIAQGQKEKDPFAFDDQLQKRWDERDAPLFSNFIDPETGERYASQEELDIAMDARGSTYNQYAAALYPTQGATPTTMPPLYAARGGFIQGPGTGTSDSVPAMIYQNGGPVRQAKLSDGEFVMTNKAVHNMGGGNRELGAARMYQLMNSLERGRNA